MRTTFFQLTVITINTLWMAGPAAAQKIHTLVVADISPAAGWGIYTPNLTMDVTNMYIFLHQNLPESNIDFRSMEFEEDQASNPDQLLSEIQRLSPGPNDTVFFYFTGHGSVDDQGHHLALAKGKLYRRTILESLQKKKPRLIVILTDCCNSRSDGMAFAPAAPFVEAPPSITPLFKSLMIEPKGVVDINSCSPGESAFFTAADPEKFQIPGSIFTKELCDWASSRIQQRVSWDSLVRDVSLQVHSSFHANYPKGAQIAKGQVRQHEQTVFAIQYPGKPENEGPRTGIVARDFEGQGAVIVEIAIASPATQVYDISKKQFVSLKPQQVLITANGKPVASVEDFVKIVRESPQIIRIGVRDSKTGDQEYLLRMKY